MGHSKTLHKSGFTLIELSIVLVIIALIVAGILVGQAMIKNSQIQDVIKTEQQFVTAVMAFRGKYNAFPGDMVNATNFWGAAEDVHADCIALDDTSPSTGTETCNGNGDSTVLGVANYERFRFWQHLTNDGMIPGHYVGVHGPDATNDFVPNWNAPGSRFADATWSTIGYNGTNSCFTAHANIYDGCQGNVFELRNADDTTFPIMSPIDAFSIDAKVDDGIPSKGRVRPFKSTINPGCTTSDVDAEALYNATSNTIGCSLIFMNQY